MFLHTLGKSYNHVIEHYLEMWLIPIAQALNYIANENDQGVLVRKETAVAITINNKSKT